VIAVVALVIALADFGSVADALVTHGDPAAGEAVGEDLCGDSGSRRNQDRTLQPASGTAGRLQPDDERNAPVAVGP
jgi:hypothetical protein